MNNLRRSFVGSDQLQQTHGQAGQDLFVLTALNGKSNGTYLEIGSAYPIAYSNTYVLEHVYGWRGVSLDINYGFVEEFNSVRKNKCTLTDATTADYETILRSHGIDNIEIDYLQLDCEPPINTYKALLQIPLDKYKFATITFEHDAYVAGPEYKILSREYLLSKGYELAVSNVSEVGTSVDFEDWWVHPDLVSRERIDMIKSVTETPQPWRDYMFV